MQKIYKSIDLYESSIEHKNYISETQLEVPLKYFEKYRISSVEEENLNDNLDELNNFGAFSNNEIENQDHWFLIAISKNNKYYVIQKEEDGKSITYFDDIDEAKNSVRENYHYNDVEYMEEYELNEKINIKDVFDFVKNLPNDYHLIDDNSQTFISNILNHYYFK